MRFETVLFDLDGTVVDSGAIILASMRHATREVLGREYSDEELMQAVGGPGLEAQMSRARARPRRAARRRLPRAQRAAPRRARGVRRDGGRARAAARARAGASASSRRSAVRRSSSRSRACPLGHLFETVVGGDETERHKPDPEPLLLGAERLGADPAATAYVGDSPFDIRAAKAAGMFAVAVTWGRIHDRARLEAEEPDAIVDTRRGAPWRPLRPRLPRRAPRSCATSSTAR